MAKILVVEDEPEIRILVKTILEKAGYSVVEAEDGEAALRLVNEEEPDLVLLDVMIPGIEGWEVCRRIRENEATRRIPIIMVTVRTTDEDIQRSVECGANAHINKPFDQRELLDTIKKLLGETSSP
ncbi:response regulator [candidate division WOR-3 bacterium]|nr:response regulator [candidate division WOR-3 bacterium]